MAVAVTERKGASYSAEIDLSAIDADALQQETETAASGGGPKAVEISEVRRRKK
jgi:hypothetical protein